MGLSSKINKTGLAMQQKTQLMTQGRQALTALPSTTWITSTFVSGAFFFLSERDKRELRLSLFWDSAGCCEGGAPAPRRASCISTITLARPRPIRFIL